jgi:hypothetical protein
MLFRLGAGGAHLGEVVTPDGTPVGAASVMTHACLLERTSEGRQVPFLEQEAGPAAQQSLPRKEPRPYASKQAKADVTVRNKPS